jgi:hypothetical protein
LTIQLDHPARLVAEVDQVVELTVQGIVVRVGDTEVLSEGGREQLHGGFLGGWS